MTTNDQTSEPAAGGGLGSMLDLLRGMSWPAVAALAVIAAVFLAAPLLGIDIKEAGAALAAIIAAGGLRYSHQAAKQTNGVMDGRIEAGTERALARLLPDYVDSAVQRGIAAALDGQPPASSSPAGPVDTGGAGGEPGVDFPVAWRTPGTSGSTYPRP